MCGIAGIITSHPANVHADLLSLMTGSLAHRGPDGEGYWMDPESTAGLAMRRLAIIDPAHGTQPMHYAERFTIVYNGALYNYQELREDLRARGHRFQTNCDTEVVLIAFAEYGPDCLTKFDGMFAFAIWDRQERVLFAARDRFGEKPFYYQVARQQAFYFASEMKALWSAGIERTVDPTALLYYLAAGYDKLPVHPERTFYQNIFSLPAAHYLLWHQREHALRITRYWQLNCDYNLAITPEDALGQFREYFDRSIRRRLRSDVPVGTSLSGGLDSSVISACCARLAKLSTATVEATPGAWLPAAQSFVHHAFTAAFKDFEKDESGYALTLANRHHLQQTFVHPDVDGLVSDFDRLLHHQEEPFGSSSIYAQYKVFEAASKAGVKVLLDGQGADEILGGYERYITWYLAELFAHGCYLRRGREEKRFRNNGYRFEWNSGHALAAIFPRLAGVWLESRERRRVGAGWLNSDFMRAYAQDEYCYRPTVHSVNDILRYHTTEWGLEHLLRFSDRNSMAHGVEVRLPFLSHELVQFVFSLPSSLKFREGYTKWLVREGMKDVAGYDIVFRGGKVGFEPPQAKWMQHPSLQEMIREARKKLASQGIISMKYLERPFQFSGAHEADNFDWRCLVAAGLLR